MSGTGQGQNWSWELNLDLPHGGQGPNPLSHHIYHLESALAGSENQVRSHPRDGLEPRYSDMGGLRLN